MFHIGVNMRDVQYVPHRNEYDRGAVCSIEG